MIAVVFNPTARGDRARSSRERLRSIAVGSTLLPTSGPGDAITLSRQAAEAGADVVVAAGGDGTVNEVVNGLCAVPPARRPAMGILPMGTVNVFARELGMPMDPGESWKTILEGRTSLLDVACAEHGGGMRRFVQLAGAGLDAEAIRRVRWGLKQWTGPLAYVWAGLGALASRLPEIDVAGTGFAARGHLVLIGNGRLYGGGFRVFPSAAWDDGVLDLAVLRRANVLAMARAALAAWHGRAESLPGVSHFQASSFVLSSRDTGARFQVEGDDMGALPARFLVEPRSLRVITGRRGQRRD